MFHLNPKAKKTLLLDFLENDRFCVSTRERWSGKEIKQVILADNCVFQCFGNCVARSYSSGVFYMSDYAIGYSDANISLRSKRNGILNFCVTCDKIYLLSANEQIHFFSIEKPYKQRKKTYKLPLQDLLTIPSLFTYFPSDSFRSSFFFCEWNKLYIIANRTNIGILAQDATMAQFLSADHPILSLSVQNTRPTFSTNIFDYSLVPQHIPTAALHPSPSFKPTAKTLLSLETTDSLVEIIDLHWYEHFYEDLHQQTLQDWRLDPLDRNYLSSEAFYKETFYQHAKTQLSLTIQILYLKCPLHIISLQEALREQEKRIYQDCLLDTNRDISVLISEDLPLPTLCDSADQQKILQMFS